MEEIGSFANSDPRAEMLSRIVRDPNFRYWVEVRMDSNLEPAEAADLGDQAWRVAAESVGAPLNLRGPATATMMSRIRQERAARG